MRGTALIVGGALVVVGLLLAGVGCAPRATPTPTVTATPAEATPVAPAIPEVRVREIPFEQEWLSSAHADAKAEAFRHWDRESPPEIPVQCAKCHSAYGFLDFLGVDGSPAGVVDKPAAIGSVIDCTTCHNSATRTMDRVTMPSGVEIAGLGPEARCMQCHQGRASGQDVEKAIQDAGVEADQVSEKLSFINIHYYAAAAIKYGTVAKGGYQYAGRSYEARFDHVKGVSACVDCHDSHTLKVKVELCSTCHKEVRTEEDFRRIRMEGSLVDYDGDGNIREGLADEIAGLQELLYQAIQAYARDVARKPIVYDAHTYPYFFVDLNGNGVADPDEAKPGNKYNAWTPRLLRAAYNYQVSQKDPGAFAHGGKYVIQLLYDSIEDLNQALATPIDLSKAHRDDTGHFAGASESFRHWDQEGRVPPACSRCHTAEGLPLYLRDGVSISQAPSNGFLCSTCHDSLTEFTRYEVKQVTFPSGAVIDSGDPNTNLCMTCHQGRESKVSVDRLIGKLPPDQVSDKLRFLNVHYFAAGATRFGTQAKGAYEYDGKTYEGFFQHHAQFRGCTDCHDAHELEVRAELCGKCHEGVSTRADLLNIRLPETPDYDGDGNTTEGLAGEIETMREALYKAIQAYARDRIGTPIAYHPHAYPYFFTDTNGNGVVDPEEANPQNSYKTWTPRLLRAAYNYQFATKDPGGYAHNGKYILQILYDSLEDLSRAVPISMKGMIRP